jgi:hypothetical protein
MVIPADVPAVLDVAVLGGVIPVVACDASTICTATGLPAVVVTSTRSVVETGGVHAPDNDPAVTLNTRRFAPLVATGNDT